jgi:primosomal protein N' (replication factor Y)
MLHIVDLRDELKKKNYSIFSELLVEKMTETLGKKEQILLFLNKRGNAGSLFCRECGTRPTCTACDVSLGYHKIIDAPANGLKEYLLCHYCGRIERVPAQCPTCKSISLRPVGVGTQKVEQEVKKLFPNARVARIDRDTIGRKFTLEQVQHAFAEGEIDILIGTQMIAKGLDIPNLNLVGVVLADIGLHVPDFRAEERTYQLLTQVAGRISRRGQQGDVVIQTYVPEEISEQFAQEDYYEEFFEKIMEERKPFLYPPFGKMIKLTYLHKDKDTAIKEVKKLYEHALFLQQELDEPNLRISWAPASIPKIHHTYRMHVLLRGENPRRIVEKLELKAGWRIDVDPVHVG